MCGRGEWTSTLLIMNETIAMNVVHLRRRRTSIWTSVCATSRGGSTTWSGVRPRRRCLAPPTRSSGRRPRPPPNRLPSHSSRPPPPSPRAHCSPRRSSRWRSAARTSRCRSRASVRRTVHSSRTPPQMQLAHRRRRVLMGRTRSLCREGRRCDSNGIRTLLLTLLWLPLELEQRLLSSWRHRRWRPALRGPPTPSQFRSLPGPLSRSHPALWVACCRA